MNEPLRYVYPKSMTTFAKMLRVYRMKYRSFCVVYDFIFFAVYRR